MKYLCYSCKIEKDIEGYYPSSIKKKDYQCKKCSVERGRKWRKLKRESKDIDTRYSYSKSKARTCKQEFNLTKSEYASLMDKPCYYCGNNEKGYGVGLDRMFNQIGYTIDNVIPCCTDCNKVRNNILTVEEMKVAMDAVVEYRKLNEQ